MRPRPVLLIGAMAAAVLTLAAPPAGAERTDTIHVPAPPGHASAVALQVGSLIDISRTDAAADQSTPEAQASVIRIGGQTILGLGGTQKGEGESAGALVDTGGSLPLRLQVAPWAAAAHQGEGERTAKASAAVLKLDVGRLLRAAVLASESKASHRTQRSTGEATSDGADVTVLNSLNLILLHSEVRSEGRGHSYLIGFNGTEIGTDDQLGRSPVCALSVPGLAALSCLTASGGTAGGVSAGGAEVGRVTPSPDAIASLNPAAALTTAAASGSSPAETSGPAPAGSTETSGTVVVAPVAPVPAVHQDGLPAGRELLPATGSGRRLVGPALAALLLGAALRFRRPAPRKEEPWP